MTEVGRPSELDNQLFGKIKECVFRGMNLGETADAIEVPRHTLYGWSSDNYLDFAKKWRTFEKEYELSLAGFNIRKVLTMDVAKDDGKIDPQLLRIQTDVSLWTEETLNKVERSKRVESTGKDGNAIEHNITGNVILIKSFKDAASSE